MVILIIPAIIKKLVVLSSGYILASHEEIRHRTLFSYFDFILFYIGILTGIIVAIVRFVFILVIAIIGFARVDQPALPEWVLKYIWLDLTNKSYLSVVKLYHLHNHPIVITFVNYLLTRNENEDRIKYSPAFRRVAMRFHVVLLLKRQPELYKWRKHRLEIKPKKIKHRF
jgi:hypothetical protein